MLLTLRSLWEQNGTPIALADGTAGTEAFDLQAAVPASDSGAGTDAVTLQASVNASDSGAGSEILALQAALGSADSVTGSEAVAINASIALADTALGLDVLGAVDPPPAAETGVNVFGMHSYGYRGRASERTGADDRARGHCHLSLIAGIDVADRGYCGESLYVDRFDPELEVIALALAA